jgi:hypothetical protein
MHWPADHPVHTDPALAQWRRDADSVAPSGRTVALLRHVPGRRVTTLVRTHGRLTVLKLFASPRARGNDRRLRALRPATGSVVPRPLRVGPAGHAHLLEYVPGRPLPELSGPAFVGACEQVGRSLARLQASGVRLDRVWTAQDEIDHLDRRRRPGEHPSPPPGSGAVVPAHRDLHPAQIVVADGSARLIDLDDATMAPPGLDVGNFLAHLDREAAVAARPDGEAAAAARAFLRGYGRTPADLRWWREIALARLAVLAVERHGRPDWAESLRALVG